MSYSFRVFSRSGSVPAPEELARYLDGQGLDVKLKTADPASPEWDALELVYLRGKKPVAVERKREAASASEAAPFLNLVTSMPDSPEKNDVTTQLKNVQQVFVFHVPTGDINEGGWRAMSAAQQFLAEHTDGILQVDGEGFFYLDDDTFEMLLDMEEE